LQTLVLALKGTPFPQLLHEAARVVADGLKAEFAKVLKYLPKQNKFLICAGVGWDPGVVGVATIGADTASPAGYALQTGKAVISNHLDNEERFRTPELPLQYGIRRAMNVILEGDGSPFGVLEADSRSEGEFRQSDIVFLQGVANILGMAIERQRMEVRLSTDNNYYSERSTTASITAFRSLQRCCICNRRTLKTATCATSFERPVLE
jgi:GAF domain-containing protein